MAIFDTLSKYRNTGLLLLRLGLGAMMMVHGLPKIMGGVDGWAQLGASMKVVHIDFLHTFWGFMSAITEGLGGFLIILGLFFRPVSMLLVINLIMAAIVHFSNGDGINGASHAIELAVVFFALIFIGPGKYSVDKK